MRRVHYHYALLSRCRVHYTFCRAPRRARRRPLPRCHFVLVADSWPAPIRPIPPASLRAPKAPRIARRRRSHPAARASSRLCSWPVLTVVASPLCLHLCPPSHPGTRSLAVERNMQPMHAHCVVTAPAVSAIPGFPARVYEDQMVAKVRTHCHTRTQTMCSKRRAREERRRKRGSRAALAWAVNETGLLVEHDRVKLLDHLAARKEAQLATCGARVIGSRVA